MPLRVGIVGARRRRQGIGEHVARHLAELGAEVAAIVGTRRETADEAREQLASRYGIETRPYLSLAEMLAAESLDAVALCSPQEFHLEQLAQAADAGVHVLCEKPAVFNTGRDPAADAAPLVERFAAAGKVPMVNEQWPYTLAGFAALYPDHPLRERPPCELTVLLAPDAAGAEMVPNALPHVLSLLFALAPAGGEAESIRVDPLAYEADDRGEATAIRVSFRYRHARGTTDVSAFLWRVPSPPRPAGYEIDGRAAWRQIEMPSYRMSLQAVPAGLERFVAGEDSPEVHREVPLADPLRTLLSDFLTCCQRSRKESVFRDPTLVQRLAILRDIYKAAIEQLAPQKVTTHG